MPCGGGLASRRMRALHVRRPCSSIGRFVYLSEPDYRGVEVITGRLLPVERDAARGTCKEGEKRRADWLLRSAERQEIGSTTALAPA